VAKVKSVMEVAEKKAREQRQLDNERWRAHIKAMKAAGKPPKSAGIKGQSKKTKLEDTEEKTDATADAEPPKSAGVEKPKTHRKKDSTSKPAQGRPRAKSAPAKKKKPSAGPTSPKTETAPTTSTGTAQPSSADASKAADTAAFTDYKLNAPPAVDVAPVSLHPIRRFDSFLYSSLLSKSRRPLL